MAGWNTFGSPFGVPSSGGPSSPGTGGGQNQGQLEPFSRDRAMQQGMPFQLVPAYPPFVRIANDPNVVYYPRFRTIIFGGNAVVAGTTTLQFQFSLPTIIIARTGWGFIADNVTGLPVGRTGLDTFRIQMFRAGSQSDLIDSGGGGNQNPAVNVIGSNVLGTAQLPALIPGCGLFVDTGGVLNTTCQILINNVEVHFTLWCIEMYGPASG